MPSILLLLQRLSGFLTCIRSTMCRPVESQVAAGGYDGILHEVAPEQLMSLRDAIVALAAEPCSAAGDSPLVTSVFAR